MDYFSLITERSSVRAMDAARPLAEAQISAILAAGQAAPTAKNLQPQRIYVLASDKARAIARELTVCTFDAPVIFLVCADTNIAWKHYLTGAHRAETDAAIVTTHMMLAAEALGLASTWVCRFDTELAKERFGLPAGVEPYNMLPVGYPAEGAPVSPNHGVRLSLTETVTYL